jgi:glutaredoxin
VKTITFYRSALCPRCHMAGRSLARLLPGFSDVVIDEVEILTNRSRSKADGVTTIPTLICGDRRLSGFYLTRTRIKQFLETL